MAGGVSCRRHQPAVDSSSSNSWGQLSPLQGCIKVWITGAELPASTCWCVVRVYCVV